VIGHQSDTRFHIKRAGAARDQILLPTASTSWVKSPLPAGNLRALDPGSALAALALSHQAARTGTYVANATTPPTLAIGNASGAVATVGVHQKRVRVKVLSTSAPGYILMKAIGDAGVPIPHNTIPQLDSDSSCFIYQPFIYHGPGLRGRAWEFWQLRYATGQDLIDGYTFTCETLARICDADNYDGFQRDYFWQVGAGFEQPWTDPYARSGATEAEGYGQETGVMQYGVWGIFGIGANPPGITLLLNEDDVERGYADHPLRLLSGDSNVGSWFPARPDRYDGSLTNYPFREGAHFDWDPYMAMPTNLMPMEEIIFRTGQFAGLLLTDRSNECLAVSCKPQVAKYMVGPAQSPDGRDWRSATLANLPWGSMRLLRPGTPAEYHPRIRSAHTGFNFEGIADLERLHLAEDLLTDQKLIDGSRAGMWTDRAGYAHVSVPDEMAQPIVRANAFGTNKPGLEFDGVRQFLRSTYGSVAQPTTIVVVGKFTTSALVASALSVIFDTGTASGGNRNVAYFSSSDVVRMHSDNGASTGKSVTGGRDILVFRFNGSSSWLQLNGSQSSDVNPGATALDGFAIGAHAGANFTDGFIAMTLECMAVYARALTSTEVTNIVTGLA
jgi:hypothetical protein